MARNGTVGITAAKAGKDKGRREPFFANVKAEFKHIRFPDAKTTVRTTGFVMVTAAVSGTAIALFNAAITYLIGYLL